MDLQGPRVEGGRRICKDAGVMPTTGAGGIGDGFANWGDGGLGVEFGKREGCSEPEERR